MRREDEGSRHGLVHAVLRNAVGNVAGPAAGLASAPVLAQAVGVDGRGTVAAVTAPLLLAAVVAGFGVPDATTYFVARSVGSVRSIRRRAALLAAMTAALASVVIVSAAPAFTDDRDAGRLLAVLAACTVAPSCVVGVLRAHAAGLGRWGRVSIERTAAPVLRLVAFLVLDAADRLDVTTAAIVLTVSPIVAGVTYISLPRSADGSSVQPAPARRVLLGYGARAWVGTLAGAVVMRLDQVLMVPLASAAQLGVYAVAVTISELPLVTTSAVREVLLTTDARHQDDEGLARAARSAAAISAAVATVLCGTASWWLPTVFGPAFDEAVVPTVILSAAVVVGVPGSVAGAALSARGLPHLRSLSLCVAAVIGTAVLVALVPTWGANGAAVATLICNLVAGWSNVAHLIKRSKSGWRDFLLPTSGDVQALRAVVQRLCVRRRSSTGMRDVASTRHVPDNLET